jgi:hypothetical protein
MLFLKSRLLLTLCAAAIGLANIGWCAETSASAELILFFRDSRTGALIVPDQLLVDGRDYTGLVTPTGHITIKVPPGDHDVVARAKNYHEMAAKEAAFLEDNQTNLLMLDPVEEPEQLKPENLNKLLEPDSSLVAGFVTDDDTGLPLENTEISVSGLQGKTLTDEKGFFQMRVPMTDAGPMPESQTGQLFTRKNVEISRAGYGPEERQHVLLLTGEPKLFMIKLARGTQKSIVDENDHRSDLVKNLLGEDVHDHTKDTTATATEVTDNVTSGT